MTNFWLFNFLYWFIWFLKSPLEYIFKYKDIIEYMFEQPLISWKWDIILKGTMICKKNQTMLMVACCYCDEGVKQTCVLVHVSEK